MNKKLISLLLCVVLIFAQITVLASQFNDVDPVKYSWAEQQITEMAKLGIINGYDSKTFGPEDAVRRVDALLLVSRIAGAVAEGEEEYVQIAYDTYASDLSNLGYDAYVKTLSYLVYREIYTISELNAFLANKLGNEPLKRHEAAVIITKLVGAEEEVKKNTMPILTFDDSGSIPATAKPYVEYCYNQGLMLGMSETEFSPNTSVTRAQMAVLLNKAMNKLDLVFSRGTVLSVEHITDTIQYADANNTTKSLRLTAVDVPIKLNGLNVSSIEELKAGDKITAIYSGSELIFIEASTIVPDQVVSGICAGKVNSKNVKKISLRTELTSSDTEEFILSDDCQILVNNKPATIDDIVSDCYVTVKVENNRAVSIIAENKTKSVSGTITAFIYEVPSRMEITYTDNTKETFELNGNVEVTRNGKDATVSDLMVGDRVTVSLVYNRIATVNATSTVKTLTGNIEEIVISATPKITVNTGTQSIQCAIDASNVLITVNGEENSNVYDLRLGDKATLTVESSTVTKIQIETSAISVDTVNIVGTVQNVDTNYMCITLTTNDGSTQQIFVKKNATILDSATQKTKTLASIKPGDTITAVITSNGFTQEAISIVVLAK